VRAHDYLRRVAYELRDLPWKMRRDLISELSSHLNELTSAPEFQTRLGTPEQYAADLRAAAGLERRHGPIAFLKARRLRNLIVVAMLLAVIGLAIGAAFWIDSYQPIAKANSAQFPVDSKSATGREGEQVVVHPGRPFLFGITIRNTGRFRVHIVGVPRSLLILPVKARLLMSGPQKGSGMEDPWKPFHPFDLHPGEIRWLAFKGVYDCSKYSLGPGVADTWVDFPVRFKFLWRTETAEIPLDTSQLTFSGPEEGCSAKQ